MVLIVLRTFPALTVRWVDAFRGVLFLFGDIPRPSGGLTGAPPRASGKESPKLEKAHIGRSCAPNDRRICHRTHTQDCGVSRRSGCPCALASFIIVPVRQIVELLRYGMQARALACRSLSDRSSLTHTIATLHVVQYLESNERSGGKGGDCIVRGQKGSSHRRGNEL